MNDEGPRDEISCLTLNWLIQGPRQHAGMTFQHLVRNKLVSMLWIRDSLSALRPVCT